MHPCQNCQLNIPILSDAGTYPMDHVAGVYYRKLMNTTDDMDIQDIRSEIQKSFTFRESSISPLRFQETQDETVAKFKIWFGRDGDSFLPQDFESRSLAYALPKYGGVYSGHIYVNDKRHRAVQELQAPQEADNIYSLSKLMIHEIGHALYLLHSPDQDDVMRSGYQYGVEPLLTSNTSNYLQQGYAEQIALARKQSKIKSVLTRYKGEVATLPVYILEALFKFFNISYPHKSLHRYTSVQLAERLFLYI